MSDGFGGFDGPAGANSLADQKDNATPWFKRWYVWLLPLAVLGGVILFQVIL